MRRNEERSLEGDTEERKRVLEFVNITRGKTARRKGRKERLELG